MRAGGFVVPDALASALVDGLVSDNLYRQFFPAPRPLTRRERWIGRFRLWEWRITTAIDVLRGRHECDDR